MHVQAYDAVRRLIQGISLEGVAVVEAGSYQVNGSVRPLFADAAEYLGIDIREGPGVDRVMDAAKFDGKGHFDVFVSTEVLEHTPEPANIIDAAWKSLRPGGALIITAAADPRQPHGVDGGSVTMGEYYQNIAPNELQAWLTDRGWEAIELQHDIVQGDVYCKAIKPLKKSAAK